MRRYQHTQIAWVIHVAMAVASVVAASVVASASENLLPALLLSGFLVTPGAVLRNHDGHNHRRRHRVAFGVGLLRRRIPVTTCDTLRIDAQIEESRRWNQV